ncbi:putative transmembrane protein [Toxoplasma gondii RUB]|uniref:Putative transmembrane protein n=1 Tax=Toxoplasma gondii RUB TaxID=935652 RepID=A0A086LLH4_TOXGO|nr:putative transmembrane protein [Toxoplasma gondii RUB]
MSRGCLFRTTVHVSCLSREFAGMPKDFETRPRSMFRANTSLRQRKRVFPTYRRGRRESGRNQESKETRKANPRVTESIGSRADNLMNVERAQKQPPLSHASSLCLGRCFLVAISLSRFSEEKGIISFGFPGRCVKIAFKTALGLEHVQEGREKEGIQKSPKTLGEIKFNQCRNQMWHVYLCKYIYIYIYIYAYHVFFFVRVLRFPCASAEPIPNRFVRREASLGIFCFFLYVQKCNFCQRVPGCRRSKSPSAVGSLTSACMI